MEDAFETGPDWSDPIKLTSTPVSIAAARVYHQQLSKAFTKSDGKELTPSQVTATAIAPALSRPTCSDLGAHHLTETTAKATIPEGAG
jgi:hypothetical protein